MTLLRVSPIGAYSNLGNYIEYSYGKNRDARRETGKESNSSIVGDGLETRVYQLVCVEVGFKSGILLH